MMAGIAILCCPVLAGVYLDWLYTPAQPTSGYEVHPGISTPGKEIQCPQESDNIGKGNCRISKRSLVVIATLLQAHVVLVHRY